MTGAGWEVPHKHGHGLPRVRLHGQRHRHRDREPQCRRNHRILRYLNGLSHNVKVQFSIKDVSVWNNAIFAGVGQAGKGINGNVDIRGSVHILGDGEPYSDLNGDGVRNSAEPFTDKNGNGKYDAGEAFTDTDGNGLWSAAEPYTDNDGDGVYDPPLTAHDLATDLSGSANIGNSYSGMPSNISAKIPGLVAQQVGSETIRTLNAEVRVKHGTLNLSGSAKVGSQNVTGNSDKETVDGVYVTDGYGGNKGASSIYSDNGTSNRYDLGNRIPFPSLLNPYTDPNTNLAYSTYEAYLDANSLVLPATVTTIDGSTANFSYSSGGNSISWNKASSTLTVTGIVRLPGDLDVSSKGSTIFFSCKGTIFGKNDIRVHGSVMPLTMFPTVDCLGMIAKRDIQFATGNGESQLSGMGAWYAQRTTVSAKQNQSAGTYVADYFDMGKNVPSIYQVPTLVSNMPPGMPGKDRVFVVHVKSRRHL